MYKSQFKATRFTGSYTDVAILQPILSGDSSLEKTLLANLKALPEVSFYWLIDRNDVEAQELAKRLIVLCPKARVQLMLFDQAPEGVNPKVFKLEAAFDVCTQDYVLVLDDDTVLPELSLSILLGALASASLSTGLPSYTKGGNLASRFLANFVNNNAELTYLSLLPWIKPVTINGMCYALKYDTLARLGGFKAIRQHLTDDLAMAELILNSGGTIAQTPYRQVIETQLNTVSDYSRQMHRWYLFAHILFFKQQPLVRFFMLLLYALPPLLLFLAVLGFILAPSYLAVSALSLMLIVRHFILVCHSNKRLNWGAGDILVSFLSELVQPLHSLHASVKRDIRWRSRRYRVYANDRFSDIDS
ncbi:glycosyltransferase family 2 protein [Agaribacterium sp. ZY112]|uniref:glycosyltransferase family 2 protein n=1 Tax=Agaribacterium sp. ZY112 TaxID=3233574 RepID=UPI003526674D